MRVIMPAAIAAANIASSVGDAVSSTEAKGVVDVVLQHGITGAMLLIVLYMYWRKDKQLADESAARVADSKAYGEAMRSAGERSVTQMERFNDTSEALVQELRTERHATRTGTGPGVRR